MIDERLIRSAQAFDEKWTTATTNISLRMKAWLAETSDTLGKLADSPFFSKLVTAATMLPVIGTPIALGRSAYNAVAGAAAPSAVNDPQRRLEGSFQLVSAENDRVASSSRTKLTADTQKLLSIESQRIGLLGATATVDQQVRAAEIGLDQARLNGIDLTDKQRAAVLQLAREQALGITAMKQQADATRIQAETLGMSAGAAAEFTAVQTRLAEALRNKQALTDQDIAQIRAQAAALGQAAQAAEQARVRQDIRFGSATALLSPDDIQIAQQLKGLYPDVATALASVEAAGLRTNAALSQVSSTISGDLVTGITDALDGTKSFGQAFSDTSKLVIRAIEEMIVKLLVVGPLMRSLQSSFGGLTGGSGDFGSLFGSAGVTYGTPGAAGRNLFGPIAPSALGNIFSRGNIVPFARGGVVTRPTLFPMANGGTGLMGEAGPEAVMPLRRGADGRLGVSAGGIGGGAANDNGAAGSVVVNIYNAPSGSDPQTSVSRTNNGTQVDIMFKNAVTGLMVDDASRNGPISQAIAARQRGFRGA
ncbi:phage tail tape measure protein [Bradyrhizobium sp. BEA-2-5]|uniref:phage tail tape measure protein n=1 Tax=Bradyrhizobium sp. BEA-2-5 TaxID=3080015 RepID=UPI0039792E91